MLRTTTLFLASLFREIQLFISSRCFAIVLVFISVNDFQRNNNFWTWTVFSSTGAFPANKLNFHSKNRLVSLVYGLNSKNSFFPDFFISIWGKVKRCKYVCRCNNNSVLILTSFPYYASLSRLRSRNRLVSLVYDLNSKNSSLPDLYRYPSGFEVRHNGLMSVVPAL